MREAENIFENAEFIRFVVLIPQMEVAEKVCIATSCSVATVGTAAIAVKVTEPVIATIIIFLPIIAGLIS